MTLWLIIPIAFMAYAAIVFFIGKWLKFNTSSHIAPDPAGAAFPVAVEDVSESSAGGPDT